MQYFLKFCFGFDLASLTKILREKLVLVLLSLRTKISGKLKHGEDSCKIFLNLKKKKTPEFVIMAEEVIIMAEEDFQVESIFKSIMKFN